MLGELPKAMQTAKVGGVPQQGQTDPEEPPGDDSGVTKVSSLRSDVSCDQEIERTRSNIGAMLAEATESGELTRVLGSIRDEAAKEQTGTPKEQTATPSSPSQERTLQPGILATRSPPSAQPVKLRSSLSPVTRVARRVLAEGAENGGLVAALHEEQHVKQAKRVSFNLCRPATPGSEMGDAEGPDGFSRKGNALILDLAADKALLMQEINRMQALIEQTTAKNAALQAAHAERGGGVLVRNKSSPL